ncbi:MAG: dienelactone hydrolase family protein [Chloroflexi bacterium]|nr:dienelactone hydrolase family protein [Chloroflexota bacterium]
MSIIEEVLDLPVDEGEMAVFTYREDDDLQRPAIVLLHDAHGLIRGTLDIARGLAAEGFVVAAPDTFHRAGRMMTDGSGPAQQDSMLLRKGMTNDGHLSDMNRLAKHLRSQAYVTDGPVGVTGFCLGGRIAFLAAAQGVGFGPSVLFYPTRLWQSDPAVPNAPTPLSVANVINPMLSFFPELDPQNPPERVEEFERTLACAPVESIVVPNGKHGFAQPGGANFQPEHGPEAWQRCIAFFKQHLPVAPA